MRIGVTYDLRSDYLALGMSEEETAEFDSEITVAAICAALKTLGYEPDRIGGIRRLAERLVAGERWDAVFNICEGLKGVAREAQVPALLEAYDIPYVFSDPLTLSLALDKGMAKQIVRAAGVATPDFALIHRAADAQLIDLPFPLFVKPVAEGSGKGVDAKSRVTSVDELAQVADDLLARFRQPVLVERYLPGREFTVGITGTGDASEALGVLEVVWTEHAAAHGYGFENKERFEDKMVYRLAQDAPAAKAAEVALAAWRALRCRDGGRIDIRYGEDGEAYFLEANPLAGLHPDRSDLVFITRFKGLVYSDLIGLIMQSFASRHPEILGARRVNSMQVLILHSDVAADAPPEELDTLATSQAIAETLRGLGHQAILAPFVPSPDALRLLYRETRADVVFNMVESVFGQDGLAGMAPAILEKLGIPFTGSSAASIALASNKPLAKRVMRSAGLPTPDWAEPPQWDGLSEGTRYIVKAASEDASLGLDDAGVVQGRAAVEARARACAERFGGRWFAEAYVEGREFNVAVLEQDRVPVVLPIAEMRFEDWPAERPRIVGYRAKWHEESEESANTVRAFGLERDDPALAARLGQLAQGAWRLFAFRGYMRVDFRVDDTGHPLILEANPNPCLEPHAGFAATAAMAGRSYSDLIAQILGGAFAG